VQQIKTNERVFVRQKNGKEIKGRMIEASDTTLTIDRDGKPFSIARADVRQVYVVSGTAQKGKWALIGAGIPEYRAKVYEAGLLSGGILLGVEPKSDEEGDKLEELLGALGGEHVRAE